MKEENRACAAMQLKFLTIDATACGLEDGTEESHA